VEREEWGSSRTRSRRGRLIGFQSKPGGSTVNWQRRRREAEAGLIQSKQLM